MAPVILALCSFLLVLAMACLTWGYIAFLAFRAKARTWLLIYLIASLLVGVTAACFLCDMTYAASPTKRHSGFPFPAAIFVLEDGVWVDYVTPPGVMHLIIATNFLLIVTVPQLPVAFTAWAVRRGARRRATLPAPDGPSRQ